MRFRLLAALGVLCLPLTVPAYGQSPHSTGTTISTTGGPHAGPLPEIEFSVRHQVRDFWRDLLLKRDGSFTVKSWAGTKQTGPEVTQRFSYQLTAGEKRVVAQAFREAKVGSLPSRLPGMTVGGRTFEFKTKVAGRDVTTGGFLSADFGAHAHAKKLINTLAKLASRAGSAASSEVTLGVVSALTGSTPSSAPAGAPPALPARGDGEVQPLYPSTVPQRDEVRPLGPSPSVGRGTPPSLPASTGGVQPLYPPLSPFSGGEIYPLYPSSSAGQVPGGFGGLPAGGLGGMQPLYPPLSPFSGGEIYPLYGPF